VQACLRHNMYVMSAKTLGSEAGGYQFPYMIAVVSRLACTGLYSSPTAALMGAP
jgi:hypothetical protein